MSKEGDPDRGRLFGFETQHIFGLAISSKRRVGETHVFLMT